MARISSDGFRSAGPMDARGFGTGTAIANAHPRAACGRILLKRLTPILVCVVALAASSSAWADLRIFACEPEWAALARELGGDSVHVDSATTPFQDVHYIQARPSLISKIRRADLVVCSGADLEIGWVPVLLRQASNAKVQPGTPGFVDASKIVPMLGVPTLVDRSQGDIHPYGNPHVQTDPHNVARVAQEISARLQQLDPAGSEVYRARYDDFSQRWGKAIVGWEQRAAPLRGMEIVTHHLAWVYMAHWLGLVVVDHLEPKPGIPPSAGHLAQLLDKLSTRRVKAIVRAVYQSERASRWLSERTGIPAIVVPHCVGATPGATNLFAMFDDMIDQLLEANS